MKDFSPTRAGSAVRPTVVLPPVPHPPLGIRPAHLVGAAVVGVVFVAAAALGYEHGTSHPQRNSGPDSSERR